MDLNTTDVGLGVGAFVASVLTYFKFKKKEDPMAAILARIDVLEDKQDNQDLIMKSLLRSNYEIKHDLKDIKGDMSSVQQAVARILGYHEASNKGS